MTGGGARSYTNCLSYVSLKTWTMRREGGGCPLINYLQFLDVRIGGVWEPNWSGVHEDGVYKCSVGGNDGLLLLAPVGTSEGLQDGESLFSSI